MQAQETTTTPDPRPTKPCRMCAEDILEDAIKCRFCGAMVAATPLPPCRRCERKGHIVWPEPAYRGTRTKAASTVNICGTLVALFLLWYHWPAGILIAIVTAIIYYAIPMRSVPVLRCPRCKGVRTTMG